MYKLPCHFYKNKAQGVLKSCFSVNRQKVWLEAVDGGQFLVSSWQCSKNRVCYDQAARTKNQEQ